MRRRGAGSQTGAVDPLVVAPAFAPVAAAVLPRDVVRVVGPDAVAFLQGQLSQDVAALPVGAAAWSLLLAPTGKVEAWLRVHRFGVDELLLDVEAGWGPAVLARLTRFKLRTRAALEEVEGWRLVAVRGPGAAGIDPVEAGGVVRADPGWPQMAGIDLLGPDAAVPDGVPQVPAEDYEAARIACGVPAMGAELTERTIPAEAGRWLVDVSVSFTKGCYTGQELVARLDARGSNVARRLRHVEVGDGPAPGPGAVVVVDGVEVGALTSVATRPGGRAIALAYVGRSVVPPASGVVAWEEREVPAVVRALPAELTAASGPGA